MISEKELVDAMRRESIRMLNECSDLAAQRLYHYIRGYTSVSNSQAIANLNEKKAACEGGASQGGKRITTTHSISEGSE